MTAQSTDRAEQRTAQAQHQSDTAQLCRLKYAYFRLLDTKQFSELGQLFVEDGTADYESAPEPYAGRDAIVGFLEGALSDPGIVTLHHGHHPEIDVHPDGTASGTWYLFDKVFVPAYDFALEGTALYEDSYVRVEDGWRFSHTGYARIYEERRRHSTGELLSFTSRFASSAGSGAAPPVSDAAPDSAAVSSG